MRTACARVLENAGCQAQCAETGDAGLQILQEAPTMFDAVLVDRLMPGGLSGMDVLAHIHALAPSVPVILMTGSATPEVVAEALAAGACDCLAKPFTPEQLRTAIRNAAHVDSLE